MLQAEGTGAAKPLWGEMLAAVQPMGRWRGGDLVAWAPSWHRGLRDVELGEWGCSPHTDKSLLLCLSAVTCVCPHLLASLELLLRGHTVAVLLAP